MNEDGIACIEEAGGLAQATTRVEQCIALVAHANVKAKVVVTLQIVGYLVGEMVNVHHHAVGSRLVQGEDDAPQERFTSHLHKGLGNTVGQRLEARAQSCR